MRNGEGYHDPTAGAAIKSAFRSEKQKLMRIRSMKNAARRECLTYQAGCFKVENGEKRACPLKEHKRECLVLTGTDDEIETAYNMLFPEKEKKMREIIIRCNHCGNIIAGDPYKVCLEQVDRESGELRTGQPEAFEKVAEMDWCGNCFHNLTAFLLDTSHLLLATPRSEVPALRDQEEDQEETPAETCSGGASRKKKIDMGKLKALKEAGWKVKDMAIEFGVSEQAIYGQLKKL